MSTVKLKPRCRKMRRVLILREIYTQPGARGPWRLEGYWTRIDGKLYRVRRWLAERRKR